MNVIKLEELSRANLRHFKKQSLNHGTE